MFMLRYLIVCVITLGAAIPGFAAGLMSPKGAVLLTVSGAIGVENGEGVAQFDRDMLRELDWREIRTFTSFTDGEQVFAGPTLSSLLAVVQAQGDALNATAINDYSVQFPASYAEAHDVILAMEQNGRPMRVRDKGPIWIVFPLSADEAQTQRFDAEMIWQLDRLSIE